jgi:putative ABC transport system permease protein
VNGEDKAISFRSFAVDEDFTKTFGVEILKGRNLRNTDSTACLINEHLYKELGWGDFAGKKIFGNEVVGVVKDFHYENLYTEIGNLQLQPTRGYASVLNIKMQGNVAQNIDFLKKTYKTIEPEVPLSFKFYDDWIQSMYQKEEKQAQAVGLFALLAIIISCLGLVGTVEHITHKKVKEIGIRKINGATVAEILALLNRGFLLWIAIAFIIAIPIAYYAMNKWLENFAYKTSLSWWIFALAGLLALGIALLTVSWQSWKAATGNPVEALRYE